MIEHATFRLGGAKEFQEALSQCTMSMPVLIEPGEGDLRVTTVTGVQIGRITTRHPVAKALGTGQVVLHSSVNSVGADQTGSYEARLRVVTGSPTTVWS